MSITEERPPVAEDLAGEHVAWLEQLGGLMGDTSRMLARVEQQCLDLVALMTGDVPGPLAEVVDLVRTGPPSGCGLRSELVSAFELVPGDRAVPVEEQVIGPEKDAFRHFRVIEGTGNMKDGQVLLVWGGAEHVIAGDWPFSRIATGREVVSGPDGDEARYLWEVGR